MKQIGVGDASIGKLERKYVLDALKKERLSYGTYHQKFEYEFRKAHDRKFAMFCNSGTSALQAGLHALKIKYKWKDDDEVIVPALTFVATVNIILQNKLKPVFVDVDPDFFEIDPSKIEKAITKKTRAIIPVHIGGHPCDMDPILKIAKKHKLKILEDSCETMFAKYKGKPAGSWGEVSCFSTYVAHILITGVGGFATTNDPELAILIKSLFNHGRDSIYLSMDDDKVKDPKKLFNIVSKRFSFEHIGYSYRATELEAAIGYGQIKRHKQMIKKRQKNAAYLTRGLKSLEEYLQLPKVRKDTEHAFMFYPIVVKDPHSRNDLVNYLEKNLIETRYLLPLLNQPVYKKLFGDIEYKYPVSKKLNNNAFYVGCHMGIKQKELDYMIKKFHTYFRSKK